MDRIEYIKDLQEKGIKVPRKQSTIVNNLFSIATIVLVCISMIYYTVYIVPAQEAKKKREEKIFQRELYLEKRAKQIALSHKLNNTTKNKNDNTK